jgi:hypothetical protein
MFDSKLQPPPKGVQVRGALGILGPLAPPVVGELALQVQQDGGARHPGHDLRVRPHGGLEPQGGGLVVEDLADELLACRGGAVRGVS